MPRKKILPRKPDPRNPAHIAAALNAIMEANEARSTVVTPQTKKELTKLGISVDLDAINPDEMNNDEMDAAFVVCAFYFLDRGLMLADNLIGRCEDCRAAIQYRPHVSAFKTRLCCFCALDRVTKERSGA